MTAETIQLLLRIAGIGHFALVVACLILPRLLNWKAETAKLGPLTREIFWTYASYIFVTNASFGALACFAPQWLTDGSGLAAAVSAFIALWWGARIVIQFTYYERKAAPQGPFFVFAEVAIVLGFVFFTAAFGLACWFNLGGRP
ncbi:MAG: hypothetical protein IT462_06865 [Planctomycetes bacterium]|nr:hypothetical protein [Planctomycetota bacterium]